MCFHFYRHLPPSIIPSSPISHLFLPLSAGSSPTLRGLPSPFDFPWDDPPARCLTLPGSFCSLVRRVTYICSLLFASSPNITTTLRPVRKRPDAFCPSCALTTRRENGRHRLGSGPCWLSLGARYRAPSLCLTRSRREHWTAMDGIRRCSQSNVRLPYLAAPSALKNTLQYTSFTAPFAFCHHRGAPSKRC